EKFPISSGKRVRILPDLLWLARARLPITLLSTERRRSKQPVVTDGKAGMGKALWFKTLWFKALWFKRRLLMASVSTGLVSGLVFAIPAGAAQDEETNVQNLPPVEVTAPPPAAVRRSAPTRPVARIGAASSASPKTRIYVYPTSPGAGRGLDVDKVPSAINAVDASQIKRTGSLNIA